MTENTHSQLLEQCDGEFLQFLFDLLAKVVSLAETTINEISQEKTKEQREFCLVYIASAVFKYVLGSDYHWVFSIMLQLVAKHLSVSSLLIDMLGKAVSGSIGSDMVR